MLKDFKKDERMQINSVRASSNFRDEKHLSRIGDYMRHTTNPELKRSLDENREELNALLAKLEFASAPDLRRNAMISAYIKMNEDLKLAVDKIKEILRKAPVELKDKKEISEIVSWFKKIMPDSKKLAISVSALFILIVSKGEETIWELLAKDNEGKNTEKEVADDNINIIRKNISDSVISKVNNNVISSINENSIINLSAKNAKENSFEKKTVDNISNKLKSDVDKDTDNKIGVTNTIDVLPKKDGIKLSSEEIEKDNLKKVKTLFGIRLFARYPATMIMVSDMGLPEDISITFQKLRSSKDYSNEKFGDLLKKNAEKFIPGELERLDEYLSYRFRNQK